MNGNSLLKLSTAHPDLVALFTKVSETHEIIVAEGHRSQERQEQLFREGKSRLHYPEGKHCSTPSMAVDVCPAPGGAPDWDSKSCRALAHDVLKIAADMGIKVRWGGDWDMDGDETDQKFMDLVHFELA